MIYIYEKFLKINKLEFFKILKTKFFKVNNMNNIDNNVNTISRRHRMNLELLIISKIILASKNLYNIYARNKKKQELKKKTKFFIKWKGKIMERKYFSKYKSEFEISANKKIETRRKAVEGKISELEKESNEMKLKLEGIMENNISNNKKTKLYEEKETIYLNKIKNIEDEKSKIDEKMKQLNYENIIRKNKKTEMENSLNILEASIKDLTEQIKDKDLQLSEYITEMNEMLEVFEKKTS
jgi:hypothetical protein